MENKDNKQLTAADIIPQCKSITLTDDQGVKHGMTVWATFEGNISDTEYHTVLDALFDMVKENLSDTDVSMNYRFRENSIVVMGGESRWMEEQGTQFEMDDRWLEFLIDMELADLPVTSNFAEFMQKLDELEESGIKKNDFYPINMKLFKKPGAMEEKGSRLPAPMVLDFDCNPIVGLIFMQELPSVMSVDISKGNVLQTIGERTIRYNYEGTLSFYCEKFKDLEIRVSATLTDEVKAHMEEELETFLYKTGSKMKEACIHNIVLLKDENPGSPSINPECLHLSALGCHVTKLENYIKE